jgi:hypothetical protein
VAGGAASCTTPDKLLGRLESVRSKMSRLIEPSARSRRASCFGSVSARTTIAVFAAFGHVLAL